MSGIGISGIKGAGKKQIHSLALLRNGLGCSQEKFARMIDLSLGTIAKIERGTYEVPIDRVAMKIAGVLIYLGCHKVDGSMARELVAGTLDEAHVITLVTEVREAQRIGGSNGNGDGRTASAVLDGVGSVSPGRIAAVSSLDRQARGDSTERSQPSRARATA